MEFMAWIYEHPELALGAAGAILAIVRWALSVSDSLNAMAKSLKTISGLLEKHEQRLDEYEVRLVKLETGGEGEDGRKTSGAA